MTSTATAGDDFYDWQADGGMSESSEARQVDPNAETVGATVYDITTARAYYQAKRTPGVYMSPEDLAALQAAGLTSTDGVVLPGGRVPVDSVPAPATAPSKPESEPVETVIEAPAAPVDPYVDETVPDVLPAWATSRVAFWGRVKLAYRRGWRYGVFHALRSPSYVLRWGGRALRGLGRVTARWWVWQFDLEARELHRAAVADSDPSTYMRLRMEHRRHVNLRMAGSAAVLLGAAAGVVVAEHAHVAGFALPAVGAAALMGLIHYGRPDEAAPVVQNPELSREVDLRSEHINAALRAAGLLKGDDASVVIVQPIMRHGDGYLVVFDLPRGGGKTAADALARKTVIAGELGVDEIQLFMWRVRAAKGGNAHRIRMWVADDDPFIGRRNPSPLVKAESFDIWKPIPFGTNAMGQRASISLLWQSIFFGGLPRRGKSFAQRITACAAALDAHARVYAADGKGGKDWKAISRLAHRYVVGTEKEQLAAFVEMLRELVAEMERRFAVILTLPDHVAPEGKLTPEIAKRYKMPVIVVIVDELQEYFDALEKQDAEEALELLCRLARRAPAAGFILDLASQRPDAESVPTKLREIITYRFSVQCADRASSDMVLGKGKASLGADASALSEDHLGVGVLVTGPTNFDTLLADYIDLADFAAICERGRGLREAAGTLTGAAAGAEAELANPRTTLPALLSDVASVVRGARAMHTATIIQRLIEIDEGYDTLTPETLAAGLTDAGLVRSVNQVKVDKVTLAGYRWTDIEAALSLYATPESPAA